MRRLGLIFQTQYAELVERCRWADFDRDFPANGSFSRIEAKGRRYWYFFQEIGGQKRTRYVGPDTEANRQRIERHGRIKADYRERKRIVSSLRRVGLPVPDETTGAVAEALSQAGAFRLGACLVGTVAFQTYAGLLGAIFPSQHLRTTDFDLARAHGLSVAVGDSTPPMDEVLRNVDSTFRPVPHLENPLLSMAFVNRERYRVEFLTSNRGTDDYAAEPARLPALGGVGAQPLRFLDFLIFEPVQAALLHRAGVLVNVPAPERYALHKLVVATRRREGAAKIDKDIAQAAALVEVLAETRAPGLRDTWHEAVARGPKWRKALTDGAAMLPEPARTALAAVSGRAESARAGVAEKTARYGPARRRARVKAQPARRRSR
jgi:hypothetical protein